MPSLCACGCRSDVGNKKWIPGHYHRKSDAAFTIEMAGYETPCWLWQLTKSKCGYAKSQIKGKSVRVHRHFYEVVNGPVKKGLHLDHLCRNRNCIRVDHLEAVSATENTHRGKVTKLTKPEILEIRQMLKDGFTNREIAHKFGICQPHVSKIGTGKRWELSESYAN